MKYLLRNRWYIKYLSSYYKEHGHEALAYADLVSAKNLIDSLKEKTTLLKAVLSAVLVEKTQL